MGVTSIPLATTDNAQSQLDASISASQTSLLCSAGEGSLFPSTLTGQATSAGTGNRLNQTGIGATGIAVDDGIYNITDGSSATVIEVNTDYVLTTDLRDGTANIFDNSDEWVINPFVVTLEQRAGNVITGAIEKMEQILVLKRTTDTFNTIVRGHASTTPQAFDAESFVSLYWTASNTNEISESLNQLRRTKTDLNILTTKGDIFARTDDGVVRLPIGTIGQKLAVDPSAESGLGWETVEVGNFLDGYAGESLTKGNAGRVQIESLFADLDNSTFFGRVNNPNQVAIRFIGNGVESSSLKIGISKSNSPTDNVVVRIETEEAAEPRE